MADHSRTDNAIRNIVFATLQKIVVLFGPFIIRTMMLYEMGTEYVGLNSLFSSILQVLSMTELGFSTAIVYSLYKPMAEKDRGTICALLNYYRKIYLFIGIITLSIGIAAIPFLKYLIHGSVPNDINIYILFGLYLFNTVISYFLFAYKQCLLVAAQRNDIVSKRATLIHLIGYIVQGGIIYSTKNYYLYIAVLPCMTILTNIANAIITDRLFPDYKCIGNISSDLKRELNKKATALFGNKLNSVVLHAADSLVISSFIGLTAVSIYGNYYYIIDAVGGLVLIVYSSITAGIGNSIVTETIEKNRNDFKLLFFINSWIVGLCSICLLCLYQPFMILWVKKQELLYPFGMVICFSLYFYMTQMRKVSLIYKEAAGVWWEDRFRPYAMMVINLGLNITLVQFIGVYGVILSTLISILFSIPWENYTVFKYVLKDSGKKFYSTAILYMSTTLISALITYLICLLVLKDGIIGLLLKMVICLTLPNIIFFIVYRKRKEYIVAKKRMYSIIRKTRNIR